MTIPLPAERESEAVSVEAPIFTDLDSCAREPIERPGSIQPYGVLLACLLTSWSVTHVSANAGSLLEHGEDLIGKPVDDVFSAQVVHDLRNALQSSMVSGAPEVLANVRLESGILVDLSVHLSAQYVIVEIIPQPEARVSATTPLALVRSMMGRLKKAPTLERALLLSATQIRAVTGFDRVMIYKFLEDGSGEVVAEALRAGLTPFLHLRYPSSDIPAQARKLYLQQWLRLIADVNYEPAVLLGDPAQRVELDLSLSTLRSVSPIHLEYLRNMGSGATLTLSLIVGDRLWGLIACHHEVPRRPSVSICNACELFAQIVSLQIEAKEQARELGSIARSREAHERLIASMPPEETLFDNLARFADLLKELMPCDGIAVWTAGVMSGFGSLPPVEEMPALMDFLNQQGAQQVYATDSLGAVFPPAAAYCEQVSGLLAVPFSRQPRDYLLFFRREVLQIVSWGGDPNKPVERRDGSDRISPRRSFAAWREEVRGTCQPWLAVERKIAESLRTSLLDVILRRADLVERERRSAQESQALLIAELNHRVKNILALIRSLVRQSRKGARSITAFTADLEQRIESLARAHDQITQGAWESAPLRRLLAAEAQVWTGGARDSLVFTGPEVLLDARAFQTMALVFHELMTNAAKYGALSVSTGTLHVTWRLQADGGVEILWQEAGGPPVKPPSRRGFGTVVVEQTVPFELQGEAQLDYRSDGLWARFVLPAAFVTLGKGAGEPAQTSRAVRFGRSCGKAAVACRRQHDDCARRPGDAAGGQSPRRNRRGGGRCIAVGRVGPLRCGRARH